MKGFDCRFRSCARRVLAHLAVLAALTIAAAALTSCNTTEGFGKDLESLGDKIENKAQEERND